MSDDLGSISSDTELLCSVIFEASELLEVIGRHYRYDSDIWYDDREHEVHFSRMVDPIFQDDIARVGSYHTRERYEEDSYPEKRIFPSCFCSYDREWESIFTIIVIGRDEDIFLTIEEREILRDMGRYRRLSYRSRDSYDKRSMDMDDKSSKKREKRKKECLHKIEDKKRLV